MDAMTNRKIKWAVGVIFVIGIMLVVKQYAHFNLRAGYYADDLAFGADAVDRFHALYNSGDYQTIYDEATPEFQNATNRDNFIQAITQTKRQFGGAVNARQVGSNAFPGGQVRFVYNTKFAWKDATELFTWQSDGSKCRLLMYRISSGTVKPRIK
jgi:hypothetical protein